MSDRRQPPARARTLFAAGVSLVVALTSAAAAHSAKVAPPTIARSLAQTYFTSTFTRAEVLTVVGRVVHDYRIDEGRVIAVRPNAIDLLERDGTRQTVALNSQTQMPTGRLVGVAVGLRGSRVVTLTDNGGAASLVRPSAAARGLGKALFGPTLARAEIVTFAGRAQDVQIDQGKITAVRPGSVTLLERDGTRQAIPVAPTAVVTENGLTVDTSAIVKGLSAITVRVDNASAQQVFLAPTVLGFAR
jgi:hypothetical protein